MWLNFCFQLRRFRSRRSNQLSVSSLIAVKSSHSDVLFGVNSSLCFLDSVKGVVFGKFVFHAQSKKTFVGGKDSLNHGLQFLWYNPSEKPRCRSRCKWCQRNWRCMQQARFLRKDCIKVVFQTYWLEGDVYRSTCIPSLAWVMRGRLVRLVCDNVTVVDATNKHSIKGEIVKPLQTFF